jgi:NADH:ubiquinone oxidoreductase subunit E
MVKTNEAAGGSVRLRDDTLAGLLPILQKIQEEKGFISDKDMQDIADKLGIHPVEVYSVVTFYSFLTLENLEIMS